MGEGRRRNERRRGGKRRERKERRDGRREVGWQGEERGRETEGRE